jgi:crotonobetainyl-CoA:carnitine CoA-transferase CaiB-like acyl-CoA transferase
MKALDGITVLDLSRGYPPAHSTMYLADFGARVIKIDSPDGNKMEKQTGIEPTDERYAAFNRLNRNKETVVLNFKSPEGRDVFLKLVKKADVLVEGFRPGALKRLGVDYEALKAVNPRLIYCSVAGYGANGPYAQLPGHDPCYLGVSGALSMIGTKGNPPCYSSNYIGDMGGAALHTTVGILIALLARERTGQGQFIDISYLDSVLSLMDYDILSYLYTGVIPMRGETFMTGTMAWSNIYRCADGQYLVIACGEAHFWKNLCRALERDDLIRYMGAPEEEQAQGITELSKIFLTRSRNEWWELLKDKNTCVAPVNTIGEAFDDPQLRFRQMVIEVDHPRIGKVTQIGFPIKLSDTPAEMQHLGRIVGFDTAKILEELGYSSDEVKELMEKGAVK